MTINAWWFQSLWKIWRSSSVGMIFHSQLNGKSCSKPPTSFDVIYATWYRLQCHLMGTTKIQHAILRKENVWYWRTQKWHVCRMSKVDRERGSCGFVPEKCRRNSPKNQWLRISCSLRIWDDVAVDTRHRQHWSIQAYIRWTKQLHSIPQKSQNKKNTRQNAVYPKWNIERNHICSVV